MSKHVLAAVTIATLTAAGLILFFGQRFGISLRSTGGAPPAPSASSSIQPSKTPSDTQIYRNEESGFTLTCPSAFKIEVRSSANSRYEKNFRFTTGTSTVPLILQITDLDKYLPLTNTPTVPEYVRSLNGLEHFKKAIVGEKDAYEYLACGSAACSQEVMFIHNDKQFQFSIEYEAYFPDEQINGNVNPQSISYESAPSSIQQIIESLEFLPGS